MNVTGDRDTDWGLASVGWDDEGVAGQHWDIVKDGILVGYQTDRAMAALKDLGRSNGAAYADSARHVPLQRMVNVSLQPDPEGGTLDDLVGQVENGIYVVGDKSWSIDMQRYNFQFTGQRFFAIENGRLSGQLRDVAYQATTTDFWRSMEAVGGPSTFYRGGALNCGKAQPGQVVAGQPRDARRPVPRCPDPQHGAGGRTLMARLDSPQDIVEAALAAATTEGTVVIVTDRSEANLRWANSSLTTNGEMSSRSVTVIATNGSGGGASAGVVGRTVTDADAVRELVAEAETAARAADPAPDAAPLVTPDQAGTGSDFALEPETTSVGAFARVATDLGEAFAAGGAGRQHFGFAEQVVDSVYLGTSTGLRLRHVQPTGRLEMNAKNADWSASSYLGLHAARPGRGGRRRGRRGPGPAPRVGRAPARPPGRPLRDHPAAHRPGRPARRGLLGVRRPGRGRGSVGILRPLGERFVAGSPCELFSDPTRPGLECAPFVVAPASTADTSVFDNGLPLPRQDMLARVAGVPHGHPRVCVVARDADPPRERQPGARGSGRDRRSRRPRRLDPAGAAALDGLVRPRRGPADPPAHRAHPRRGLPRRGRRGGRCGQQLPVERVAAGRARPHHRGGGHRALLPARVGRLLHAGGDASGPGLRLQHEQRERRPVGRSATAGCDDRRTWRLGHECRPKPRIIPQFVASRPRTVAGAVLLPTPGPGLPAQGIGS